MVVHIVASDNGSNNDWHGMVLAYKPLAIKVAKRYAYGGAEFEDVLQEAYRGLIVLIPLCPDPLWLPYFLKSRLPGYVRQAARKLRGKEVHVELESVEEIVFPHTGYGVEWVELEELLRRILTDDELIVVWALLDGYTQKEIAARAGISQQAVGKRLYRIRRKLTPVLWEDTKVAA